MRFPQREFFDFYDFLAAEEKAAVFYVCAVYPFFTGKPYDFRARFFGKTAHDGVVVIEHGVFRFLLIFQKAAFQIDVIFHVVMAV